MTITFKRHVKGQTSALLRRFAFNVNRTARVADPDAIHDLRVSIRRLSECLRLFGEFFPRGKARKIRRVLAALMELAAEVRNRDITHELLKSVRSRACAALRKKISDDRVAAERNLRTALRTMRRKEFSARWRNDLELES